MFLPTSRYYQLPTATLTNAEGREIEYVRRRFVPRSRGDALEHTVSQGDRIDNIAVRALGNPELYWRICDANAATRPAELTEVVGRVLRIPLFAGSR